MIGKTGSAHHKQVLVADQVKLLWKKGETYAYDPTVPEEALRWINVRKSQPVGLNRPSETAAKLSLFRGSSVVRQISEFYIPSELLTVELVVVPAAEVSVYAVEDKPPNDWTTTNINQGGAFDLVNRKVKWGPFFDNTPRVLSYKILSLPAGSGAAVFESAGSFDGARVFVSGPGQVAARSRLRISRGGLSAALDLKLVGETGAQYAVEASEDLKNWHTLAVITNLDGSEVLSLPSATNTDHQFYRGSKQ